MIKSGLSRVVLLVCSVLALAFAGAGVAQAATNFNGVCEAGEFCLYERVNRGGLVIDYGAAGGRTCDSTYTNNNFPGSSEGVNDEVSSWWNRLSGITVRIYDDSNYGSNWANLPPGYWDNMANNAVGDDDASSHRSIGSGC